MTDPSRGQSSGVAIVMAGTRGIGRACVETLSHQGYRVAVCAREALDEEVTGAEYMAAADVSDPDQLRGFIVDSTRKLGDPSILVVNSGGPPAGDFFSVAREQWDSAYRLTVASAVTAIGEVVPTMKSQGHGRIIVIGSSSVRRPIADLVLSKTFRPALAGLVKDLAVTLAPYGITANMVAPGRIDTERVRELDKAAARRAGITTQEARRLSIDRIPAGRYGTPEEVANVVAFLASKDAGYVTGQTILIDGGMVASLP